MYKTIIDFKIAGIPCKIGLIHYLNIKGDPKACNPDDFYGYTELDYDVLTVRGKKADWLIKKMTDADELAIEEAVKDEFNAWNEE